MNSVKNVQLCPGFTTSPNRKHLKFKPLNKILFLLPLLLCNLAVAQVPPSGYEAGTGHAVEAIPPGDSEGIGYYQQEGKHGFVLPGNKRQKPVYDNIQYTSDGFIVQQNGKYGITDKKAVLIGSIAYDSIYMDSYRKGNVYIVKKNGKYGTLSTDGKPVLSPKYNEILFSDSKYPVSVIREKSGDIRMIANDEEKPYSWRPESVALYNNLAVLKVNGKFGVVKKDRELVPFEYDGIYYTFSKNSEPTGKAARNTLPIVANTTSGLNVRYLIVQKDGKFGLIDSSGNPVYAPENDAIYYGGQHPLAGNYYLIKKGNLQGAFFPAIGKKLDIEYSYIYGGSTDFIEVTKNGRSGIINYQAELVVPIIYQSVMANYSWEHFLVQKDGKKGLFDKKGNEVIPAIYDDINSMYQDGFENFRSVKSGDRYGIINMKNEPVIPLAFEYAGALHDMFQVVTLAPDRKHGLYDKTGKVVVPAEYRWIGSSTTEHSKLIVLKKTDETWNFLDQNNKIIFPEDISAYGYIPDEEKLLNPFSRTGNYLLYIKDGKGRFGALNESTGKPDIPMLYDSVYQRFEDRRHTYLSVSKNGKYGLINEQNRTIIPLEYDAIDLDLVNGYNNEEGDAGCPVIVAKGKKYGTVNFRNETGIPFVYTDLKRIGGTGFYKAKSGKHYQVINEKNEVLNKGPFDEVSNFERTGDYDQVTFNALTFYNGQMRVIDEKGQFLTKAVKMQPHRGYTSFDELKFALIRALDSPDDALLKDFAQRITPSAHILHYLKENMFNHSSLDDPDTSTITLKYYEELLQFKHRYWQSKGDFKVYNHQSLTGVTDYTLHEDGYVTNRRNEDHAFGDTRFMEKLLRNAIKINGYWISTYFMKRNFW